MPARMPPVCLSADVSKAEIWNRRASSNLRAVQMRTSSLSALAGAAVFPWKKLPSSDAHYAGAASPNGSPCNGLCRNAKLGEFLKDMLDRYVDEIDFTKYDNDGP